MKGRFEAGDLLAFLYALVLVRQAFWLVPETVAWAASVGVAALLAFLRLRSRQPRPPLPAAFWWGTAAPLGVFWALHVPFPDVGWDVLDYHLLHGERAFRGLIAIPGDFYPHYFPFLNPAPDMLTALLRFILGYRLGTLGSYLVLVWTGAILFRVLERAIASRLVCAFAALCIICSEGILWEVGNYMVDLFGLPLLLEAALLVIPSDGEVRDLLEDLPLIGLLLGSAVAFKLTNLVFAVAIGVVLLGRLLIAPSPRRDPRRAALSWALAAAAFLLPLAPHTLLLWWTTGSPVFPHYNALFRSTLFPPFNIRDGRFGPTSRLQAFVWPVVSVLHPERLSELGLTSGRLALGFLGSIAALLVRPRDPRLPGLAVLVILGSILWSFGTGNHRYGLFAELAGGLVLVLLAARGISAASGEALALRLLAWLPVAVLGAQSVLVLKYVARSDWSGRPTAFHEPRAAWRELRRVGVDRDLKRELPAELRNALPTFAGWVDAAPKTNGLMVLLAPRLPMIGLSFDAFLELPVNQVRFNEALRALRGRPLACLAYDEDLEDAKKRLALRGFVIRRESRHELPFFSNYVRLDVVALELEAPPSLHVPAGREPRVLSARELVLRRPTAPPDDRREDAGLLGSIDEPAEGAKVRGTLVVRGWARVPGQDLTVQVVLDGVELTPDEFRRTPRPNLEALIPALGSCATAGYEARVVLGPENAGAHDLAVIFRSRDGRERHYPGRRIIVLAEP
ncbi:MAG TPA: hypothetical protein VLJ18_00360 [Thermoanaerobaculia bacterium]|nr:hypothetical protein [Thermoanaerobaculia bacterium]